MIAVSVGSAPITDLLLQNGADPNIANENNQTPVFYAASKGFLDM
jgi:ankyrin repeat protein